MKILYIANDRRIAEHAAAALRPVHPDVAVAWATGAIGALRWVDENRNVAAIIVEVESENPSLEWFLSQVRSSGVSAPVIVVSLKVPVPPLPALEAIADRVVPKTPTFLNELPQVVSRALQARQSISERSLRLLYVGEAKLLRECVDEAGESVEVIQAAPGINGGLDQLPTDCRPGVPLPFDILMIEHGYRGVETLEILRDVGLRRLPIPTVIVAEWDDELARVALEVGARDFIPRSQASFRTFVFRLKLLIAYAALLKEQSRPRDTHAFLRSSVVDDLGVRREGPARPREADKPSQKDAGDRHELESQLTSAQAQIDQLREQLDAARRVVEESRTLQQTEKATAGEREQLERQLRATVAAVAEADQRAQSATEGLRARETALQADIDQERARREKLEQQLKDVQAALADAQESHASDKSTVAAALAEHQTRLDSKAAEAASARDQFEQKLTEAEAKRQQSERVRELAETAFAEQLALHDAEHASQAAQAAREKQAVEEKLSAAEAALRQADERHDQAIKAVEARLAERQAAFDVELEQASDGRRGVEDRLRDAEASIALGSTALEEVSALRQKLAQQHAGFTEHRARIETEHAREAASRQAVEQQLADATLALQRAEQRHASEMSDSASRLAEQRKHAAAGVAALQAKLVDSAATLQRIEQQAATDRQSAAEEVAQRQAKFDTALTQEVGRRQALAKQLTEAEASLQRAEQQHASEMTAAAEQLAAEQQRAERRLADAAAATTALKAKLVDSATALSLAEQRAAFDRQAASEQALQQQAEFEAKLAQELIKREALAKQLTDAEAAHQQLVLQHASEKTAAAERLDAEQRRAEKRLADAAAVASTLEAKLVDSATALSLVDQRAALDRQAASEQALQRQAEFETQLAREVMNRQTVAGQLADAEAAHQRAEQRHSAEMSEAAARLADHQKEADTRLAQAGAEMAAVRTELGDTASALTRAQEQAAAYRQAAVEEAAERQSRFDAAIVEETGRRHAIVKELTDAQVARERAEQQHAAERAASAAALDDHRQQAEAQLAQAIAQAAADRQRIEDQHASEIAGAAARLAESQRQASENKADAEAQLAQAAESIEALRADLASAVAERTRAEQQAAADLKAAAAEAAERQAKFDAALEEEIAKGRALATQMADADAAHRRAEEQHASELAAANDRFAAHQAQAANDRETALKISTERQAAFDAALAQASTIRQALEKQLADSEAVHEQLVQQHLEEMTAAAAKLDDHQRQFETQLAQALENAAVTLQAAERRAESDRRTAAEEAVERQKEFEKALRAEAAQRQLVEQDLAAMQAAAEETERRFLEGVETMRQSAREHEARLEERAGRERAEWESTLAERQERIEHLQIEGDLAVQSLVAKEQEAQRLERKHKEERANLEQARATLEADLTRRHAEFAQLQQTLDEVRATGQATLERVVTESSTERATLEARVADRDRHLEEQARQKETSDRALAEVEGRLRVMLEAHERDNQTIQQMQEQVTLLGKELESAVSHSELLKTEADRVPQLRKAIEEIQAANRHHFDHAATSMCRVSRDGAITQANQAFVKMLGYNKPEQLQKVDFAASVFEVADELPWIIDRCLTSRSTESIETAWRTKDGGRVIVRLVAVAASLDSIDLAVQDLTPLRALEEKLNNAQRLEAVARYASEVAFTCEKLLEGVQRDGQEWLPSVGESARRQGQLLLDEVNRATGFLKQLTVYGKEQVNAPELVDVKKVLRDLEPVLKRVAGGNIELVLPKASTPHNLDVEQERVERILVNVAAYGRERMRTGGRLMIEVASVVVDRNFVAKYPNVRPGGHVLFTVTEKNGVPHPDGQLAIPSQAAGVNLASSERPGIDLGALQALIDNCGGHLWMTAEPPGDMVLKIHLPRRVLDDGRPAKASGPSRWISRLPGIRH